MRLFCGLVFLASFAGGVDAQTRSPSAPTIGDWTIAFGGSGVIKQPRANNGEFWNGVGGLVRVDRTLWRFGKLSAGINAHATLFGDMQAKIQVCTIGCHPARNTFIESFAGAGLSVFYAVAPAGKWQPYLRGFAEPIAGRALLYPDGRYPMKKSRFIAPFGGAAAGIARGPLRLDFESAVAMNVHGDNPMVFSVQLGAVMW